MNILILGSSPIAEAIAVFFCNEKHSVTIVDHHHQNLTSIQSHLDIRAVHGHPSYPDVLRRAEADQCDLLIAVCNQDEINMLACQVAHSLFNIPKKIARISSSHYLARHELFGNDDLPVDVFINTERLVCQEIERCIGYPGTLKVSSLDNERLVVLHLKLTENALKDFQRCHYFQSQFPSKMTQILAVFRDRLAINHDGRTTLKKNDDLFILTEKKWIKQTIHIFHKKINHQPSVLIGGGGRIGGLLGKQLSKKYNVKLIEKNRHHCSHLTKAAPQLMVLQGDITDKTILQQEDIQQTDVFCATTNNDEVNLIASIQAKHLGASFIIALVNREQYFDVFAEGVPNILISPQQLVLQHIFQHTHQSGFLESCDLNHTGMQLIIVELIDQSVFLSNHKLPSGCHLCGIYQNEQWFPRPQLPFEAGQRICLLIEDKNAVSDLEYLFQ